VSPNFSILRPAEPHPSFGLFPRVIGLTILFATELVLISVWLDNAALISQGGLLGFAGHWGAWTVRGIVGFAAIFFTFAYLKNNAALNQISSEVKPMRVNRSLLAGHVVAMAAFGATSWALYGNHTARSTEILATPLWLAAGILGIILGAFAFIPLSLWVRLLRNTGALWVYSLLAVIAGCLLGGYSQSFWVPSVRLTFGLVKAFLGVFVSGIIADPATATLGTAKFSVEIAPECSGFEGAGLILAFGIVWLCLFRGEYRFPQALILIPAGIVSIYLLNAVRITGLILIGNAGAPRIASGGFHSQAGWIAFNAVALAFAVFARRMPWLNIAGQSEITRAVPSALEAGRKSSENTAATYLLPFLSILAVGMVTSAASSDFEWLYPLRFLAAGGALWFLRKRYAALDWRFGWFGPVAGALAFAIWIAMDAFLNTSAHDLIPDALAGASAPARITWIAFRTLAAVTTVPIAEEFAFRAFLIRRFISPDIEALPAQTFTWIGLAISSVAFGLLHGNLWFAGILAGLLYAWALIRRGRIGEAVMAHATTNALLAGYVLVFQKWHLWL
jgi:exosortase E/protease (VPEID-CTERM system)